VILNIARHTIKAEGLKGLYRGFGVNILGSIPAAALYYGSYEYFKEHLLGYEILQRNPFLSYFLGGMFAETISCLIFVPVDIIKERR